MDKTTISHILRRENPQDPGERLGDVLFNKNIMSFRPKILIDGEFLYHIKFNDTLKQDEAEEIRKQLQDIFRIDIALEEGAMYFKTLKKDDSAWSKYTLKFLLVLALFIMFSICYINSSSFKGYGRYRYDV